MLKHYQKPSYFTLDKLTATFVLFIGVVIGALAVMSGHYAVDIALIASAFPLIYLVFGGRLSKNKDLPEIRSSYRIRTISHIIFIISFSLSIWLLWSNLYYRPPLYFILILVAASSIMLDIFCFEEKASNAFVPLTKIIILSLSIYGGIYYEYSGVLGSDPWLHNAEIQEVVNAGSMNVIDGQYYQFPAFYTSNAITQISTSLSTYSSIFASVGVFIVISCIFVFLVGRNISSSKVGLLAALIFSLADQTIIRATSIIPMSLGLCFLLAILYLVLCRNNKESWKYSILIIILSISLILTHPIASLVTLISLITIYIGIKLYKQINNANTEYEVVSLALIVVFAIIMFLVWIKAPPESKSFFDSSFSRLISSLQTETQFSATTAIAETSDNSFLDGLISYLTYLLNNGGYFILLALAIFGCLIYLRSENLTGLKMAIILTLAALVLIPRTSTLLHINGILPERWIAFQFIPLSILGLYGLIGISNFIRSNLARLCLIMAVVMSTLFIMTAMSSANSDSQLLHDKSLSRNGYTESEISVIRTLSDISAGCPTTDIFHSLIFPYIIGYDACLEMVTRNSDEIFITRNYFLNHPEWNNSYKFRIRQVTAGWGEWDWQEVIIIDYLQEQGIDKTLIYNNGSVKAYIIPESD